MICEDTMQINSLPSLFSAKFLLCLLIITSSINSVVADPNDVAIREPNSVLTLRRTIAKKPVDRGEVNELFRNYCKATVPWHRRQLETTFLLSKKEALSPISERLKEGSRQEKINAIKLIPAVHWIEAVPVLTKLLSDTNEEEVVRVGACYALGELGIKTASSHLLDQLKRTPSVQVRRASLLAIGNLKDPNYAESIKPYLENSDDLISLYTEVALARMGQLKDKPNTAIRLSDSNDWAVRSEAIRALGSIGGKDATHRLEEIAAKHHLPGVQLAARQAIEKARLVGMDRGKAVEYLRSMIRKADRETQIWAMDIAAKEFGKEGLNILKEKAEESGEIGKAAAFYYMAYKQDR